MQLLKSKKPFERLQASWLPLEQLSELLVSLAGAGGAGQTHKLFSRTASEPSQQIWHVGCDVI